jgi:hypothetical protein
LRALIGIRARSQVQFLNFQKAVQLTDARGMAHFAKRFGLDLPDALAGDPELLADFLECACTAVTEAET